MWVYQELVRHDNLVIPTSTHRWRVSIMYDVGVVYDVEDAYTAEVLADFVNME